MDETYLKENKDIVLGFGKAASWVLAGYFTIKLVGISAANNWHYLLTPYGYLFLFELLGFVALPCFLFAVGSRDKNLQLIKISAILTVIGIIINRLNVSVIAFNWHLPLSERYFPSWHEIGLSIFMVMGIILAFRFIVNQMPVFYEHPDYKGSHN